MLDLRLRYEGQGRFQTASKTDFDLCSEELQQGALLRAQITQSRSIRQNSFFHAVCEAAYENQRSGPKLPSWRHLKAYLLVMAGHCEEVRTKLGKRQSQDEAVVMVGAIAGALRRRFDTVWTTLDPNTHEIVMRFAKSTSKLTKDEMGEVLDKVLARIVLEIVPGTDPESLLNMARSKAA